MLSKAFLAAAGAAIMVTFSGLPVKAIDLQPGQWEISTKRERDGVVETRPSRTMCITPEKARQITKQISKAFPTNEFSSHSTTCKILDVKETDREVTWRAQCTGLFPAEQSGRYVIDSPEHYTSTVRSSVNSGQKTLSSTLTTQGRRTGECPK
jgi:hypothetical protein